MGRQKRLFLVFPLSAYHLGCLNMIEWPLIESSTFPRRLLCGFCHAHSPQSPRLKTTILDLGFQSIASYTCDNSKVIPALPPNRDYSKASSMEFVPQFPAVYLTSLARGST